MNKYENLYKFLGYYFKDEKLLEEALTHPSLSFKRRDGFSYERLELLGDAILSFLILEYLFKNYPQEKEGNLSKRKAALVCTKCLADIAKKIGLDKFLLMSKGESKDKGRQNDHNLENAVEALIGAIYLDGGINITRKFVLKYWSSLAENLKEAPKDSKTRLQEWTQKEKKSLPKYIFVKKEGTEHKPKFFVKLEIDGFGVVKSFGTTKKEAEKKAAKEMLKKLKIKN